MWRLRYVQHIICILFYLITNIVVFYFATDTSRSCCHHVSVLNALIAAFNFLGFGRCNEFSNNTDHPTRSSGTTDAASCWWKWPWNNRPVSSCTARHSYLIIYQCFCREGRSVVPQVSSSYFVGMWQSSYKALFPQFPTSFHVVSLISTAPAYISPGIFSTVNVPIYSYFFHLFFSGIPIFSYYLRKIPISSGMPSFYIFSLQNSWFSPVFLAIFLFFQ